MLRDLLVHVDGSDAGRRRLQLAIDLALKTGARLSGLHVMPPPDVPPLYKPSQLDEAVANKALKLASNARAAKEAFKEEVAQRLADTRWLEADGDVVDGICDRARYADLVILGQYEWQTPHLAHPLPIAHSVVSRVVARYLWSLPPLDQFRSLEPRLHGMAAARPSGRT